jgi:ADP-ribosylglycohydrolase
MEYISDFERDFGISQEPYGLALNELTQAQETGHDVSALRARFDALGKRDDAALLEVYEAVLALPPVADWPHFEGSALNDIVGQLPEPAAAVSVDGPSLDDKVRGAWFGRIAGNMVGKPVEFGWPRAQLKEYLVKYGAYPLADYVPLQPELEANAFGPFSPEGLTAGSVVRGVRDDDIDYTILGLHILETYGLDFTTRDVAVEWLTRFPVYQVYTAERATYQNLVREVPFDEVGEYHNPFREWIGAQIRADIFGYVHAGNPRAAALLAYKDAALSHRANGIYGEMWAAALVATGFTATSPEQAIELSLEHVPATSRLAEEVRTVLADFRAGLTWEQALDRLDARYSSMSWVHTLNNTGALTAGILWGGGDYTSTVGLTVQAGLDTDSTGATAGSWAGAFVGRAALPSQLIDPLNDATTSAVFGFGDSSISSLADRTLALIAKFGA